MHFTKRNDILCPGVLVSTDGFAGSRKLAQDPFAAALATKGVAFGQQEVTGGVADAKQAAVSASNMDLSSEKSQILADTTKDVAQSNALAADVVAESLAAGRRKLFNFQGEMPR